MITGCRWTEVRRMDFGKLALDSAQGPPFDSTQGPPFDSTSATLGNHCSGAALRLYLGYAR